MIGGYGSRDQIGGNAFYTRVGVDDYQLQSFGALVGILGFGGDLDDGHEPHLELSAAFLLSRQLALGAEWRSKPDNLAIAREDDWFDVFLAWAPNKRVSLTLAYVDLGNVVIADDQRGFYASLQVGF